MPRASPSARHKIAVDFQLHLETESVEHAHPAKPLCVAPEDSVRHVMRLLKQQATGAAMVCRDCKLLGVFTERDALKLLADGSDLDQQVAAVMVRDPVTLRTDDTVGKAIGLMAAGGFRRLPVVDGQGRISGVLKVSGIIRYLVDHFPKTVYTLPPAPHHKTVQREGA